MNLALALLGALALGAGDEVTTRARADVDHAMGQLAKSPAPRVAIAFAPAAGRGYALEAASFTLDGKPIATDVAALRAEKGAARLFAAEVAEGSHELSVKLLYAGDFGFLSYMTGYKFKLAQQATFDARHGLELVFHVAPKLDENKEWQQRLSVGISRSEVMLAEVDATEPAPLPRPPRLVEPPAPPPDVLVAAAEPVPAAPAPAAEPAAAARKQEKKPRPAKIDRPVATPSVQSDPEPVAVAVAVVAVAVAEPPPEPPAPAIAAAPPEPPTSPPKIVTVTAALSPAPAPEDGVTLRYVAAGGLFLVGVMALLLWRRRASGVSQSPSQRA